MTQDDQSDVVYKCVVLLILGVILLNLYGCGTKTRSTAKTDTDLHETITVSGSATVPLATGPVDIPVRFKIERDQKQVSSTEANKQTTIDIPELSGALIAALKQAFPAIGALIPAPGKDYTAEIVAAVTALATAGYGVSKHMEARRLQKDNDEAWDRLAPKPPGDDHA